MIYLQKGQKLFDNVSVVVFDQTGYYNDGDPVVCALAVAPDEPVCRYEAKFIAYGSTVYSVSDTEKLTEDILKMDPNSLFGKDSQEVAVDKLVEKIIPQESGEVVEAPTVDEVIVDTENPAFDTSTQPATSTPPVATTTPEVIQSINTQTSTTTPGVVLPIDEATSTPVIDPAAPNTTATSTQGGV